MPRRKQEDLLFELVRDYYSKVHLKLPEDCYLREFAIQPLGSSTYLRHLSFKNEAQLRSFILENVPRHLYFSSARYRDPSCPDMAAKGWLGSDLVFDIDADHIPKCLDKVVEFKICRRCGEVVDSSSKTCPKCGSSELIEFDYVPTECVSLAKDEVLKLIDAIERELGYKSYSIAFSGHRGFHVRVELRGDDAFLPSEARREIVSYLKLEGVDPSKYMVIERKSRARKVVTVPPRVVDVGVKGRIGKALAKLAQDDVFVGIVNGRIRDFKSIALKANDINSKLFDAVQEAAIAIDEKVTMDISRLIRIPGSINGKCGWLCIPLNSRDLDRFELSEGLISPIPNHKLVIKLEVPLPKIRVLNVEIEGNAGDILVLDSSIALFLVFKGLARLLSVKR